MPPGRFVFAGALLTAAGLAVAATAPISGTLGAERTQAQETAGGVAVVVGWALLGWGIHRLGRERSG